MRDRDSGDQEREPASDCVHLLEYTHLDWAWCFSREWHRARYDLIFEEALARAVEDRSFRFFVDSLCESLLPYLAERPDRVETVRRLLATGQLAMVGGQVANLRPSTAPEETYLRNLQEGQAVLAEWFPGVSPLGYANMDTAIGHSQLPQVLALAGFRYLMVGRPELGLELDGVPKLFRWQGAGSSEVMVLVQHYGILEAGLRQLASADPATRERGAAVCRELLAGHVAALPSVQWAFLAADDMRFRRDHVTDEPVAVERLSEAWRAELGSELVPSTPDRLYEDLAGHLEELVVIRGPVDHADVGYNGPFGPGALRALRDRAGARLVEAELSLALLLPGGEWPGEELRRLWRLALRAQTHATQYLFAPDLADLRMDLANVVREAERLRDGAVARAVPGAFPHETQRLAVFNPLPRPGRLVVPLQVMRTDFTVQGYAVTGGLPQQAVAPVNPGRSGEWELLVELDLPACGFSMVTLQPGPKAVVPPPMELALTGDLELGPLVLHWQDGLLVRVARGDMALMATEETSVLEPLRRPAAVRGWMTTAVGQPEERCCVRRLRQTEFGPLRWAMEREAMVAGHLVWQRFTVTGRGELEVVTEIDYGVDTCMLSLAVPCPQEAELRVSIPFGVEDRVLSGTHYSPGGEGSRVIERLIPGMLYARDWARFVSGETPVALAVLDGDRYWLRREGEERLEHLLTRVCAPTRDGWVKETELAGAGRVRVRHLLALGEEARDEPALDERVDRARLPVRSGYARAAVGQSSLLAVEPGNVRFLSARCVGSEIEVKLVENGDLATTATVAFAKRIGAGKVVDLRGETLPVPVVLDGKQVSFPIGEREIRVLRVRLVDGR